MSSAPGGFEVVGWAPFSDAAPTFATPIFRSPMSPDFWVQEVDEYRGKIEGFRRLEGEPPRRGAVDCAAKVGDDPVLLFCTADKSVLAGSVSTLKPKLQAMLDDPDLDSGVALQIAELVGNRDEQLWARSRLEGKVAATAGVEAANAFTTSAVVAAFWDRLVGAATSEVAARRILAARSKTNVVIQGRRIVRVDVRALDSNDFRIEDKGLFLMELASETGLAERGSAIFAEDGAQPQLVHFGIGLPNSIHDRSRVAKATFEGLFVLEAWFQRSGVSVDDGVDLHVGIEFGTASISEPDDLTFMLGLLRCEVVVVILPHQHQQVRRNDVAENDFGFTFDLQSMRRTSPKRPSAKSPRWFQKRSSKFNMVHSKTSDGEDRWAISTGVGELLIGAPWVVGTVPLMNLVDARRPTGAPPVKVWLEIRCLREDLVISDIDRLSLLPSSLEAAAQRVVRSRLLKRGLGDPNLGDPYERITLARVEIPTLPEPRTEGGAEDQ